MAGSHLDMCISLPEKLEREMIDIHYLDSEFLILEVLVRTVACSPGWTMGWHLKAVSQLAI